MARTSWESSRRAYLPPGWSHRIVPRILARDRYVCYLCGRPGADGVDHIERGDNHDDSNLAAVHHDVPPYCHRAKTGREGWEAQHHIRERCPAEPHPGAVTTER